MAKTMKPLHPDERYLLKWTDKQNKPESATLEFENRDELNRWLTREQEKADTAFDSADKEEHEQGKDERHALQVGERQTEKADKIHKRAEKITHEDDREWFKQKAEEQDNYLAAQKKRKEERERFTGAVKQKVVDTGQALSEKAGQTITQVSQWSTPGSIGLLVVLLLILAATVVPVNAAGDTRLKQFWYMLSGRAALSGAVTPIAGGIPYTDQFGVTTAAATALQNTLNSPLTQAVVQGAAQGIPAVINPLGPLGVILGDLSNIRGNFGGLP